MRYQSLCRHQLREQRPALQVNGDLARLLVNIGDDKKAWQEDRQLVASQDAIARERIANRRLAILSTSTSPLFGECRPIQLLLPRNAVGWCEFGFRQTFHQNFVLAEALEFEDEVHSENAFQVDVAFIILSAFSNRCFSRSILALRTRVSEMSYSASAQRACKLFRVRQLSGARLLLKAPRQISGSVHSKAW